MIFLCSCSSQAEQVTHPNIVIIFADDLGYGDVSALNPGAELSTPAIDELAANGCLFTHAHASGSVCTPSRYGLLTGRYFWRSETPRGGPWGFLAPKLETGRETMASMLKHQGYHTAVVGKWHLGLDWATTDGSDQVSVDRETKRSNADFSRPVANGPNAHGFDYSFIHPASTDMTPYMFIRDHQLLDTSIIMTADVYPLRLENTVEDWDIKHIGEDGIYWGRGIWWRNGEMSRSFRLEDCLPRIREESIKYIEERTRDHSGIPFFLYIPLTGPHTPWLPSRPFTGKTPMEYYADFVRDIDDVVAGVAGKAEQLGIADNTMVIFTSDNGAPWPVEDVEKYGHNANEGRRGQKGDVWDGGHHIPLIVSYPEGFGKGSTHDELVSLTDLFATLAEFTGFELEDDMAEDSYSFLGLLQGGNPGLLRDHMVHQSSRRMFAIRKDGWKYIDGLGSGGFTAPAWIEPEEGGPEGQLYRISRDPLESQDLYLENPEKVEEMKAALEKIIEQGYSRPL